MLPFILISTKGNEIELAAKKFFRTAQSAVDKLNVFTVDDFEAVILPSADCHYHTSGGTALILCGFIRHPEFVWDWEDRNTAFFERLLADLNKMDAATIRAAYTGSFTLFFFNNNQLKIFNTFSGLQPVYYRAINDRITICSSLLCLQHIIQEPVRDAGALQMTLNEWMETYTRTTILENVYRLVSSEQVVFHADGTYSRRIIPFVVNYMPEEVKVVDCVQEVWEGYKDIGKQFAGKNLEACMCLSGGVDSRTCLTAIYPHVKKLVAVNHGREDYYEFQRAKEVATAHRIPIYVAHSPGRMFPAKRSLEKYFLHDGGVVIEYDAIKDVLLTNNLPKQLILGDLFETFKVDGTSMWEGRANKQKTTLHLMWGGKPLMQTIEVYGFDNWVNDKVEYFMRKMGKNAPLLTTEMRKKYDSDAMKKTIRADLADWLNDFKHFGVKYIEDLNEIAYWLSKGRTAMWLQSSSGSGINTGFTLFCTDKYLAAILGVPLKHKLRQKLHFYMFRLPDFKATRRIPTPQIPYTAVTAPLPWKELVMYVRLKADRMIGKKAAKKGEHEKTRLLKGPNYNAEYNDENLERYLEWYGDECISKEKMKAYFKDIQEGRIGAVSTIDFIGLAKAEFMVSTCKKLALEPVTV